MPAFLIAVLVVAVDQATKAIAVVKSWPSLVRNTGAAFGLFRNQTLAFILISVFAIALAAYYLAKKKTGYYLPFALILGGAVGNLIDRLRFGYVVDFIDLHWWPVFNVADSCITVGAVLLFFIVIRGKDASRPV